MKKAVDVEEAVAAEAGRVGGAQTLEPDARALADQAPRERAMALGGTMPDLVLPRRRRTTDAP